jgi:hypothetical protein
MSPEQARAIKNSILLNRESMDDVQKEKLREAHSTIKLHADAYEYGDDAMKLILADRVLGEDTLV